MRLVHVLAPPILIPFVSGTAAIAQPLPAARPALTVTATSRIRYELIDGQARTGFDRSDDLLSVRTTLGVQWRRGDWTLAAELYDSRAYLADRGTPLTTGEVNAVELVQAHVGHTARLGRDTTLVVQAGRMMLNIGSRRLVAADDYRNTTNSYTGLRADLKAPGGWSATALYTLPQQRLPDRPDLLRANAVRVDRESFDLVLWGGLAAKTLTRGGDTIEASVFHLGERDGPRLATRDRSIDTAGLRAYREPQAGRFDYDMEVFGQWGRASASTAPAARRLPVRAGYLHAELGYSLSRGWKPRLSIEYDRASGDAPGGGYGRFDTLFGMRRAELAPSGLYNAVGRANLSSPGVRVEVTPDARTDAFVAARALWLAERTDAFSTTGVRDASGRAGGYAGEQVDARIRWWAIPKRLRLELDAVWLRKARYWRIAPNSPGAADTRYLSLNATASF